MLALFPWLLRSQQELLCLEVFMCLFIAQVLLKMSRLDQNHLWHCDASGMILAQVFL